jgi:hypothetical protein
MEREIPFGFSIYLSESAKTGISDRQCEDHLAFDLEASSRIFQSTTCGTLFVHG